MHALPVHEGTSTTVRYPPSRVWRIETGVAAGLRPSDWSQATAPPGESLMKCRLLPEWGSVVNADDPGKGYARNAYPPSVVRVSGSTATIGCLPVMSPPLPSVTCSDSMYITTSLFFVES